MTSSRDRLECAAFLAALLARHTDTPPGIISGHVTHLQRLAQQARRLEERYCNEPDFPRDTRMIRLQKHAAVIAADLGAGVRVDLCGYWPRPCASLYIEGTTGDSYAPGAYAIY